MSKSMDNRLIGRKDFKSVKQAKLWLALLVENDENFTDIKQLDNGMSCKNAKGNEFLYEYKVITIEE